MATDFRDDPRVYLASERTFLAWIRTGLSLMGFGFVVSRFSLFLREFSVHEGGAAKVTSTGFSQAVGVVLVIAGVLVNLAAILHHLHVTKALRGGEDLAGRPSHLAIVVAIFLALVGLAMAVYLISVG
jgi:putative membrane protein